MDGPTEFKDFVRIAYVEETLSPVLTSLESTAKAVTKDRTSRRSITKLFSFCTDPSEKWNTIRPSHASHPGSSKS